MACVPKPNWIRSSTVTTGPNFLAQQKCLIFLSYGNPASVLQDVKQTSPYPRRQEEGAGGRTVFRCVLDCGGLFLMFQVASDGLR